MGGDYDLSPPGECFSHSGASVESRVVIIHNGQ